MPLFTDAEVVSQIVWQMKTADLPRGTNRAAIDRLFNGFAPLTENDRLAARANTNVNTLNGPKIAADARRTYYQAFFKTSNYCNVTVTDGDESKRMQWGRTITTELNRILKKSLPYFELLRNQFAMTVLHGIGPVYWPETDRWCPVAVGLGDVMIPDNTRLEMANLPYFAIFRQFTPFELNQITANGDKRVKGWRMDAVKKAIDWADEEMAKGNVGALWNTHNFRSPERIEARLKENSGLYASDVVPTIDCWDFYYWSDQDDKEGWRRCMILDTPISSSSITRNALPDKSGVGLPQNTWLYKSDDVYCEDLSQIIHFQFGDASAVGPFKYHAVRSLGWLLYSPCHLFNRLFNKVSDATFEAMMQYFRVTNPEDKERVLKVDLHNLGVVPEGLNFVTQAERWQVNMPLAEFALNLNRQSMNETASSYREGRENATPGVEKTATQIMAEVNSANAIVGAMLLQAYTYARFQYIEIFRRFCNAKSIDPDVKKFRKCCLKKGVPMDILDPDYCEVEPEQVMGSGNKILQVAMTDKLMGARTLYDPPMQREILHQFTLANTDDAATADRLVPMGGKVESDTSHEADQSIGTLLAGLSVRPKVGENQIDVIESWLAGLAKRLEILGNMKVEMYDVMGLENLGQNIGQRIQILAQDEAQVDRVKQYTQDLMQLMSVVGQLAQAAAQAQPQEPQLDPVDAAKIAAMQATAQTKSDIMAKSGAQKLDQKAQQFALKQIQSQESHHEQLKKSALDTKLEVASEDVRTAADIRREGIRAAAEQSQQPAPESE